MARKKRNDLMAGMFILMSMVALAAVLVLLQRWDRLFQEPSVYYVQFENVSGIRVNSEVMVKGQPRGRVSAIDPRWVEDAETGVHDLVYLVALELHLEYPLRQDARVVITMPMLGPDGNVSIEKLGTGPIAANTEAEPIMGYSGDMMQNMLAGLGIGDEQREQISQTIGNVATLSASLKDQGPQIARVLENVEATTGELRSKMPSVLDSVQEAVDKLKSASDQMDGMLTENREDVRKAISNVQQVTATVQEDVSVALASAKSALAKLDSATGDVQAMIAANRLSITSTLTNIRLTSEQLKAATAEIHRAPWRLLHRPDERQSDTLNVYDATRNYANAAAELRSTLATLESLAAIQQSGVEVNSELMGELQAKVRDSLKRYDEAEEALWKLWTEKGPE